MDPFPGYPANGHSGPGINRVAIDRIDRISSGVRFLKLPAPLETKKGKLRVCKTLPLQNLNRPRNARERKPTVGETKDRNRNHRKTLTVPCDDVTQKNPAVRAHRVFETKGGGGINHREFRGSRVSARRASVRCHGKQLKSSGFERSLIGARSLTIFSET
jgi:hypothetical protein